MTQFSAPPFHVLIAAAGTGTRFGGDVPKQYLRLGGKPVLRRTIEAFLPFANLASLRVIIHPGHADMYHDAVLGLDLAEPIHGGKERKDSINNAIESISNLKNEDIILVHDGARPLIAQADIEAIIVAMTGTAAATLATPVTDTLRRSHQGHTGDIVERDGLWALQTPQAFQADVLRRAHQLEDQRATDDTSLVSALGIPVTIVEGSATNIKITRAEDMVLAEKLIQEEYDIRTGTGFDVHGFSDDAERKLMLCGVEVPHDKSLKGHSDADVGLHALTDALLGALAEGDIGQHFPPSNPDFKDMDSRVFLEKAHEILTTRGGVLQNADITLICEEPKIGPHRERMQSVIAGMLGTDAHRVSVKATTTEKLGFTGRGEGIAAQALVTIKLPRT